MNCGNPHNLLRSSTPANTDLPQSLLWTLPQCIAEINDRGLDVKVIINHCYSKHTTIKLQPLLLLDVLVVVVVVLLL